MIFLLSLTLEAGMGWGERYFPPGEFLKVSFDRPFPLSLSLHHHTSSSTSFFRLPFTGGYGLKYKNLRVEAGGGGFLYMLERENMRKWGFLPLFYLSGGLYPREKIVLKITLEERLDGTLAPDFMAFSFGIEL